MSIQAKAFQFSLLIHGTLFAGLVLAGLLPTKQPPPLVIDFSLNLTEARAGEPAASPGPDAPPPTGAARPQSQTVEAPPAISPPKPKEIAPPAEKNHPAQAQPAQETTSAFAGTGEGSGAQHAACASTCTIASDSRCGHFPGNG